MQQLFDFCPRYRTRSTIERVAFANLGGQKEGGQILVVVKFRFDYLSTATLHSLCDVLQHLTGFGLVFNDIIIIAALTSAAEKNHAIHGAIFLWRIVGGRWGGRLATQRGLGGIEGRTLTTTTSGNGWRWWFCGDGLGWKGEQGDREVRQSIVGASISADLGGRRGLAAGDGERRGGQGFGMLTAKGWFLNVLRSLGGGRFFAEPFGEVRMLLVAAFFWGDASVIVFAYVEERLRVSFSANTAATYFIFYENKTF